MTDYRINMFYSEEDGGWIADIQDLSGCSAFGESPVLALREVLIAKRLWLESAKTDGATIPEPRFRPAIYQVTS